MKQTAENKAQISVKSFILFYFIYLFLSQMFSYVGS